jgi:hypothetical protein
MLSLKRAYAWHRPLMAVAALMVLCAAVCLVGAAIDPRQVAGSEVWLKPLKFSLSILLYCVTWAWLIAHLPRFRKVAHTAGTVIAVAVAVEQVAIVGAAASATTSHFNVSTPFATALWGTMAVSITVLYVATFVTTVLLFWMPLPSVSLTVAVRTGAALALVGLGLVVAGLFPSFVSGGGSYWSITGYGHSFGVLMIIFVVLEVLAIAAAWSSSVGTDSDAAEPSCS